MSANVHAVLRAAQPIAQRNAAVLDHISAPPPPSPPPPSPPPSSAPHHAQTPASASAPPSSRKRRADAAAAPHHAHVTPAPVVPAPAPAPAPTAPSAPAPPISKRILSAIFASLRTPAAKHVFVENDQENHFLYGLVLPLIARLLAVSTPGLLCVVQLPRPDTLPEWALPPPYEPYGSNASASKSAAPTTPSPPGASRTASPSDEGGAAPRKSLSPDGHPGTAELIRHAEKVLSGAEAAAERANVASEERSPPPNALEDHRALRLICNGFEVLTGKMPPPRVNMGAFTLASVGWEKAAVVSPEDTAKGVSMSFSNGMMTPTEGVVVTFSNGSMVFLTLHDPLSALHALKLMDATPVVVFTFCSAGQMTVADLLAQKKDTLPPEAARVRTACDKPNMFFVEIGHAPVDAPASLIDVVQPEQPAYAVPLAAPQADGKKEPVVLKKPPLSRAPPVLITAIPRAVPLFVNTINQTFIDAPFDATPEALQEDLPDNSFHRPKQESEEVDTKQPPFTELNAAANTPTLDQEESAPVAANVTRQEQEESPPVTAVDVQSVVPGTISSGVPNGTDGNSDARRLPSHYPGVVHSHGEVAQTSTTPASVVTTNAFGSSGRSNVDASSRNPESVPTHAHPSVYNYYGYGPSPVYQGDNGRPHHLPHQALVPAPVAVHQNHPPMSTSHHHAYCHQPPVQATGPPAVHSSYHPHHPGPPYPPGAYYAMPPPPPGMMHQAPPNSSQWHHGISPVQHAPPPLPPPHPMDARRDMPVHFSSHRAVASTMDGQYSSPHYYAPPANNGHVYASQPNGVIPEAAMRPDLAHSGSALQSKSGHHSEPTRHTHPNGQSPDPGGSGHLGYIPQASNIPTPDPRVNLGSSPQRGISNRRSMENASETGRPRTSHPRDSPNLDRARALEALIRMGESVPGGNSDRNDSGKWVSPERHVGVPSGKRQDHSMRGSEQQTSPGTEEKACGSSAARNRSEGIVARVNGVQANAKSRVAPTRSRPSAKTNSGTSTNSQGGALVKGAVTGNSHMSGHGSYSGSQPHQKRARQR